MLQTTITREVTLSVDRANRLFKLAQTYHTSESQVVEKAERQAWQSLSEASLNRLWDNEEDAAYDNWRQMYGVAEG